MRGRARIGLVVAAGIVGAMPLAPRAASADPASLTVSVSAQSLRVGHPEIITAKATDGTGGPVPDGTQVTFSVAGPRGGVIVDDFYVGIAGDASGKGYWLGGFDGQVRNYGDAPALGAAPIARLQAPVAEIKSSASSRGYFLLSETGQVFAFGDALQVQGSQDGLAQVLNGFAVAIAPTPSGRGYIVVDDLGDVVGFGDAVVAGQLQGAAAAPVVDALETADGRGYWLLTADGQVWSFGDAPSLDSPALPEGTSATALAAANANRTGYWVSDARGDVFDEGTALSLGSATASGTNQPVTGMASNGTGGWWAVGGDGLVTAVGSASVLGDPYVQTSASGLARLAITSIAVGTSTISASAGGPSSSSTQVLWSQPASGYWLAGRDGGVLSFGIARFEGSAAARPLNSPIVGMARTPDGGGYWLVAQDGGVFAFGDAAFFGSTGAMHLNRPIVGMAVTGDGGGYWLVAADGGIFAFGDAGYFGSTAHMHLNQPIIGMAPGFFDAGYWLASADGGVFGFGDAPYLGSTAATPTRPVVGIASLFGLGYWLVSSDGGVFSYGIAEFHGSAVNVPLRHPITGLTPTLWGDGYWLAASDGGVFSFGSAEFDGSEGDLRLNAPIVGIASVQPFYFPQAVSTFAPTMRGARHSQPQRTAAVEAARLNAGIR